MESEQSLQFSTDDGVPSTDGQGSDYLQEPRSLAPPDDGVLLSSGSGGYGAEERQRPERR